MASKKGDKWWQRKMTMKRKKKVEG
jgi:hypothetical protein